MTITVQNTDITGDVDLQRSDTYILTAGTTHTNLNNTLSLDGTTLGPTGGVDILIYGTLYSQNSTTINLVGALADNFFDATIYVGATGSVIAPNAPAIISDISNTSVVNDGYINGGITLREAGSSVFNTGTIFSRSQSIRIEGSNFKMDNSGDISFRSFGLSLSGADATGAEISNSGSISAAIVAVASFGAGDIVFTNTGSLTSTSTTSTGILLGDDSTMINSGTITSEQRAVGLGTLVNSGDIASANDSAVFVINLTNSGNIFAGSDTAARASGEFNNSGTIDGVVNGANYTGVGRAVNSGTIKAGEGTAFLFLSDAAELYNSGLITSTATAVFARGDVFNAGSIVGDVLVEASLFNTGSVTGMVTGNNGANTINNRGLMVGDIDMSGGNDLYYGRWGAVEGDIFLGGGDDTASGGAEGERIEGGSGLDRIFGFGGEDSLFGDSGNDRLRGGDGDDVLNGGDDNDDLWGNDGDDVLFGGDGNDLLRGDDGADVLNGGSGYDRASYRDASAAITLNLLDPGASTGVAAGDSYVSIEVFEATNFNDIMIGSDVRDILRGFDGDDVISGNGGNDLLQGYEGDDTFTGGSGNDAIDGGNGRDVANFSGDLADYTITMLMDGRIRVEDNVGSDGNDGIDTLTSIEFVTFGGGAEIDVTGLI